MAESLRYAIDTVDCCCHHEAGLPPDAEPMGFGIDELRRSDARLQPRILRTDEGRMAPTAVGGWRVWMHQSEVALFEVMDPMREVG